MGQHNNVFLECILKIDDCGELEFYKLMRDKYYQVLVSKLYVLEEEN